jgi:hypothetical protein
MPGRVVITVTPDLEPQYTLQEVRVTLEVFDLNDNPTDPGGLVLRIARPDSTEVDYSILLGTLVHDSTGVYHYDLTLAAPFRWVLKAESTGPTASTQVELQVAQSILGNTPLPMPTPGFLDEGKIARVTGGVYVPYGGAADEQPLIWRVGQGWISQALNLAAATAVSGLLAVTHIAPGTNGYVLGTSGGVATWVPGGGGSGLPAAPDRSFQFNNSGFFGGQSYVLASSNGAGMYFTGPAGVGAGLVDSTASFLNFYAGCNPINGRNGANSANVPLLQWAQSGTDVLSFGSQTVASARYEVNAGGLHKFLVNNVSEYEYSSTGADFKDNFIKFGTNPSGTGIGRFGYSSLSFYSRNSGNTADVAVLTFGVFNSNLLQLGDGTNLTSLSINTSSGGTTAIQNNSIDEYTFSSTQADWKQNSIINLSFASWGTTPATVGLARIPHNQTFLVAKDSGGTDRSLIAWSLASNNVLDLGSSAIGGLTLNSFSGGSVFITNNAVTEYQFDATNLTMNNNNLLMGTGFISLGTTVSGTGLIRVAHNGGTILSGRNNANTQDVPLIRWGAFVTDLLYIGSTSSDAGKVSSLRLGVNTGGDFRFEVNGLSEYQFDSTAITLNSNNLTGAGFIDFGTGSAASGLVRIQHGTTISGRINAGTADATLINWGGNGNDTIGIGDVTRPQGIFFDIQAGSFTWRVAGPTAMQLDVNKLFLANSGTPPSSNPSGGVYLWSVSAQSFRARSSASVEEHITAINGGTTTGTTKQIIRRENRLQTTNATTTDIDTFTIPDNTVIGMSAVIVARNATTAEQNVYIIRQGARRRAGGAAAVIGAVAADSFEEQAAWDAIYRTSVNDVKVSVTGAAAQTIEWWVRWEITLLTP